MESGGTINANPIKQYAYFPYYIDAVASVWYDADSDGNLSENNDGRYLTLHDANFNVVALVDGRTSSLNVIERYSYTPYGEVTILNGASDLVDGAGDWSLDANQVSDIGNELLFTGRRLDPKTGLYYFRNRFYHAQMGRFVNRDPIGYAGGDANLYGYVGGMPTGAVDPYGESIQLPEDHPYLENLPRSEPEIAPRRAPSTLPPLTDHAFMVPAPPQKEECPPGAINLGEGYPSSLEIWLELSPWAAAAKAKKLYQLRRAQKAAQEAAEKARKAAEEAAENAKKAAKSRGYDRPEIETKSGRAVKDKDATDDWDDFLGPDQTNIDPRDGLPDHDRIWSGDGKRSIRYGEHEMFSSPNKHHYHRETWHDDRVENELQRIQQTKPKTTGVK